MIPFNPTTNREFSGRNLNELASSGFQSMQFAGFRQWLSENRIVKKGEHGIKIIMFVDKKQKNGTKKSVPKTRTVFAYEQTEQVEQA